MTKNFFKWVKPVKICTSHTVEKYLKIIIKNFYYFLGKTNPLMQNA